VGYSSHTKCMLRDYQRRRVMSFLDPWADPRQDGYQLIQSLLAVGSGGTELVWAIATKSCFIYPFNFTDFILPSLQKSLALAVCCCCCCYLRDIGVNSGNQGSQCCSPACGDGCHDFDARTVTAQYWCYGRLPTTGLPCH